MKKRTKKLVRNDVQVGLTLTHLGMTSLALVFQFLAFLGVMLSRSSGEEGVEVLNAEILRGLVIALGLSLVVVLPLCLITAILTTHRIAGPIVRFRDFLERVLRGEKPDDMRLRQGDKLEDLCVLLNQATRPLREGEAPAEGGEARPAA